MVIHGLTLYTWGLGFRITFYLFLGKLEAADLNLAGCYEWCDQKHSGQKKMVGGNPYTEELLQLEQCAPVVARPTAPQLAVIKTPLKVRSGSRHWLSIQMVNLRDLYCVALQGASESV